MSEYEGYSFRYHPKFKKEFNKILNRNKCPSLKSDFKLLQETLILNLNESKRFPKHVCMHVVGVEVNSDYSAFIVKKFRCKTINRGVNSGFRITFVYDSETKKFIFVEFFNKNSKKTEDKNRINNLFKKSVKIHDELYEGEQDFLNSY